VLALVNRVYIRAESIEAQVITRTNSSSRQLHRRERKEDCRKQNRNDEAYSLEGIGLGIEATDEDCSCFGAGLDRLAPFWSSLCFFEPLGVSASSLERLVEVAGEAGSGVSFAFVRLRPSLFQAGTCCSAMLAVARGQIITCKNKKRRNKKYAEVASQIRGRCGSACQGGVAASSKREGKHAL
jgi:hypothetical protein